MERKGKIKSEIIAELSEILETDAMYLIYGERREFNPEDDLMQVIEKIDKKVDIPEISFLIPRGLYEKLTLIAMRRLPEKDRHDIYEFILDKIKNL